MRHARLLAAVVAAVAALAPARATADSSIACSGGIVQVGDSKLDLVAKCGRPALEEQSAQGGAMVETLEGQPSGTPGVGLERWTYNFGPSQFIRIVTLEAGRVQAIERGGYGYPPEALRDGGTGRARCEPAAIREGDRKLDLLARCGRPAARDYRRELRPPTPRAGAVPTAVMQAAVPLDVETFTYDFGPQQTRAIVTLENGTVVRIERAGYGSPR